MQHKRILLFTVKNIKILEWASSCETLYTINKSQTWIHYNTKMCLVKCDTKTFSWIISIDRYEDVNITKDHSHTSLWYNLLKFTLCREWTLAKEWWHHILENFSLTCSHGMSTWGTQESIIFSSIIAKSLNFTWNSLHEIV